MSRVMHFEIHAENPERAIGFYKAVFGWEFTLWDGGPMDYWMIKTGEDGTPGINGGMLRRHGVIDGTAVTAYVCTIGVSNLDESVEKASQGGGIIALPKMPIPGMGWLAYVKDTEGNVFGMMQPDPDAG
jgi:uncharacterized protein